MEYKEFLVALRKGLERKLSGDYHIETILVYKNNTGRKEGLALIKGGVALTPVIYPEELYQRHKEGVGLEEMAGIVAGCCIQQSEDMGVLKTIHKNVLEWKPAKGYLMPTLVNRKWNQELLEEAASVPFLDLAVCFCLQKTCQGQENGMLNLRVSKRLMDLWGVTEEDLMEQAQKNLKRVDYAISGIKQLMEELITEKGDSIKDGIDVTNPNGFAVLTTPERMMGAVGILRKELLLEYANRLGKNLFLIPSSIHEILLLADNGEVKLEELSSIIKEVNQGQVRREEQLSDHPYYYDRMKHEIRVAEEENCQNL